jgi:class 3 adenylate cyclase/tetratricopeptide (TPR) repeat protein
MTVAERACPTCGADNPERARFCWSCGSALGVEAAPAAETRKTVTILYCDAISSTALGERIDPESLRSLMTRYFDVMREVIEFHGGVVEKFIGDAVMAVFGVPTVHEDDALRACRAAVEIRDRLAGLDAGIHAERGATVEWRMGINTGEVVAGDGSAAQRIVTGDAVNVAARLEGAAAPGEILLGADTFAMVRSAVSAKAVEPLSLKGKAEPVPAWRLTGVLDATGRHARPLEAPLVGRQRPLRLLDEAFREAVEERICHLFTVLGVAGVGKSRLVDEFIGALGDQAQVVTGRCLAYGHGITYWPVAEAIRDGAGIRETDSAEVSRERLSSVLAEEPEAERIVEIVAGILGLEAASPPPEQIFWAIRKTFERLARQRPLVLAFDDVQWGEPTFLDLVEHIADWTRDAPILLIALARSELIEKRPAWGGGKRWSTTVQLEPLSEGESDELLTSLLGHAQLPAEVRSRVSGAAEGNPLFVEELLAKLIDDGFLTKGNGSWLASRDLRELTIPPTIQALLSARLDGLESEERTVIERASVEGNTFHRGAVIELAPEPIKLRVTERLTALLRMELVRPDQASFAGEEAYRFRHLLIRDAAYQALAKQTRSELHERFADWLEQIAADRVAEYGEIVAYHLEQAYRYRTELGPPDARARELATRASGLLADAGRRADLRADAAAAADLLGRAVDLMPPDDPERGVLMVLLARRLPTVGEAARADRLLVEVVAAAARTGDERAGAWAELALVELRSSTQATMVLSESMHEAERLRDILARLGDPVGASLAELVAAWALFSMGRAGEAASRARAALDRPESVGPWLREARIQIGAAAVFGPTPCNEAIQLIEDLVSKGYSPGADLGIGRMLTLQGAFDDARERITRAARDLEELGDRFLLTETDAALAHNALLSGDAKSAVRLYRESYDRKIGLGDRGYASTTAVGLSTALLADGDLDEAWRYAAVARETSASDDIASQTGGRGVQARVLSARRQHAEAEDLAREAVAAVGMTDYLLSHGEVLMHLAHVLRGAGKEDEAVAAAREALALYEQKGATFYVDQTNRLIDEWTG